MPKKKKKKKLKKVNINFVKRGHMEMPHELSVVTNEK
jgi:hypothetical protein